VLLIKPCCPAYVLLYKLIILLLCKLTNEKNEMSDVILQQHIFFRILLTFCAEFDHVTQTFQVKVKGQGHSVKTSSGRQILAPFFRKLESLNLMAM